MYEVFSLPAPASSWRTLVSYMICPPSAASYRLTPPRPAQARRYVPMFASANYLHGMKPRKEENRPLSLISNNERDGFETRSHERSPNMRTAILTLVEMYTFLVLNALLYSPSTDLITPGTWSILRTKGLFRTDSTLDYMSEILQ